METIYFKTRNFTGSEMVNIINILKWKFTVNQINIVWEMNDSPNFVYLTREQFLHILYNEPSLILN